MINNDSIPENQLGEVLLTELLQRAYKMLVRREYSVQELRIKFQAKASAEVIESVISRLIESNAQSDARYAEMLCRARFNSGKGPVRIRYELSEQCISEELIESAMAGYEGQWKALADKVRIRKFGDQPPATFSEWSRQAKFLQQRGFSFQQIPQYKGSL